MESADWLRHFRRAKTLGTLDVMLRRKLGKHPEQEAAILEAYDHREQELVSGRLEDILAPA